MRFHRVNLLVRQLPSRLACLRCPGERPAHAWRSHMPVRTTTRRRQLGATMRKLRTRKGLTLEEAGRLVGVSKATISRYETQSGPVKWLVIDTLCREYGATDAERMAVVSLAKDAEQQ